MLIYLLLIFEIIRSSLKIGNMFGVKDPMPLGLRTCVHVVNKFLCAGCTACCVGRTSRQYPRVLVSIWSIIGPLTFSDICKILNDVAPYVLISVLAC